MTGALARLALVVLVLAGFPARGDVLYGQRALQRGDPENAYKEFKAAAEAGDTEAARRLGLMLGRGIEFKGGGKLEARPAEAAHWYRVCADKGDVVCADVLGAMLAVGRGVQRDPDEALQRFRQAGRPIDAGAVQVTAYPEADRTEILAWFVALGAVMRRELKPLRGFSGAEGKVVLEVYADPPHVAVTGEADRRIVETVEAHGKEALELAPPPPAAIRRKAMRDFEFVFR